MLSFHRINSFILPQNKNGSIDANYESSTCKTIFRDTLRIYAVMQRRTR